MSGTQASSPGDQSEGPWAVSKVLKEVHYLAGEMVLGLTGLPSKHEDLSSLPRLQI